MSPQFRAKSTENHTSCPSKSVESNTSNACSSVPGAASCAVHAIMDGTMSSTGVGVRGKRVCDLISPSEIQRESSQPFLSSYGSAFLSGIFADIAEASQEDDSQDAPSSPRYEHVSKKSRRAPKKSFSVLNTLSEAPTAATLSTPSIISPRSQNSNIKIELFDQVRELQNLAFPSLPGLPVAISSSSCATATTGAVVTPRDVDDQDQDSFGWFVATDDDGSSADETASPPMFLPVPKPDLAFSSLAPTIATAPVKEEVDVEVQQALAADTIDDVLGDLF